MRIKLIGDGDICSGVVTDPSGAVVGTAGASWPGGVWLRIGALEASSATLSLAALAAQHGLSIFVE